MHDETEFLKLHSLTKNMSLLLLNDDTETLKYYDELFSMMFKKVSIAQLPSVAIKKLNKQEFDILITDNQMPEMFGIELIQIIKDGTIITNELLRDNVINIPILMMTGEYSEQAEKRFTSIFANYSGCDFHMIDTDDKNHLFKAFRKLFSLLDKH